MNRHILSLKKGAAVQLTQHFNSSEFDCHCEHKACTETLIDIQLLVVLERIRIARAEKTSLNSAYRCEAHNKEIGGEDESQHVLGKAADLKQVTCERDRGLIENIVGDQGGIGHYSWGTHVDTRGRKARWAGR